MNKVKIYLLLVLSVLMIYGWGSNGHKIINRKSVYSFPAVMSPFLWWRDSLAVHGPDADARKSTDPTESPRHYIDIDIYPEFLATGRIPQNLDSLIAIHGSYFVTSNGIVPFAIINYTDSVKKYFQQHNWQSAMLRSADLGHYVADAHNPLHDTRYYDGWSAFSSGIHSRYETSLINRDSAYIQYSGDSVYYINDINNFAFNIVYSTYRFVDSVYRADSIAHVTAGNVTGTLYYDTFWGQAGIFTTLLFKRASNKLACLIYTAWINAGSPLPTGIAGNETGIKSFELFQNYPNPFNPSTTIKFYINKSTDVKLTVFDALGRETAVLCNSNFKAGEHAVVWNSSGNSSGVYYYKLQSGSFSDIRKMLLVK